MTDLINYLRARHAWRHAVYHILTLSLIWFLSFSGGLKGGGPCNAGIVFLIYCCPLFIVNIVLIFISAAKLIIKGADYRFVFFINLSVFATGAISGILMS